MISPRIYVQCASQNNEELGQLFQHIQGVPQNMQV